MISGLVKMLSTKYAFTNKYVKQDLTLNILQGVDMP